MNYQYQHPPPPRYNRRANNESRYFVLMGCILLIFFALSYKQNQQRLIIPITPTNNTTTNTTNNKNTNPQSTSKDNPENDISNNYFTSLYNDYYYPINGPEPEPECSWFSMITGMCDPPDDSYPNLNEQPPAPAPTPQQQSVPCTFFEVMSGNCNTDPRPVEPPLFGPLSFAGFMTNQINTTKTRKLRKCTSWNQYRNMKGNCDSSNLTCRLIDEQYGFCKR